METRRDDGGFTLVELLLVIVIVGILSAIAVPAIAAQSKKAKYAAMKTALKQAVYAQETRATDDLPYATPGDAGLAQLVAAGYEPQHNIELTVVDDRMTGAGGGFCLRAHQTTLTAADDMYFASSGDDSGVPTFEPCVAS